MRTRKKFDCLEFKRRAQAEIFEDIQGLGPQEQIDYFVREAANGPLGAWWRRVSRPASGGRAG